MKKMYIAASYDLYCGEPEELMERATENQPFTFYSGVGMALERFENEILATELNGTFDFTIPAEEAYGEYDTDGVLQLDKKMFYNGDGEFDSERVYVGAIVPMNTSDGQVINAQIAEITKEHVTIDLNHPLAGENLHFIGKVLNIREVTEGELKALHHRGCGGCHGTCGECGSDCNEGGCGGNCHC